jgi:16S rRNA (guanine966-N2)-methyltransferase
MPDRVKQAIFDMLGSRYDDPGTLPPLLVADVFAGGGSMGLEALSRGAAFCSFFERNREVLEVLRRNIESLGAGPESCVVPGDAWRASMATPNGRPFALIFLDPPYRDCEDTTDCGEVRRFLRWLGDAPVVERLVVLHHPAGTRFVLTENDPWRVVEKRCIGSNAVTFFTR